MAMLLGLLSILMLIGWVWILIWAFSDSILWGIGILIIGPLALVYGLMRFEELKVPTILYAIGFVSFIGYRVI